MNTLGIMAASEAAESSEGIGALGLSLPALLASTITFLTLFWIVRKYVLKGVVDNLQKREEDINRGLHLTAEMDKQKAELEEKVEQVLKNARKDADSIVSDAKVETGKIIAEAEEKASRRADEIILAAEGKIVRDIDEARQGLKAEMAGLVTEATEAILQQKLDAQSDRRLVEQYLKEAMK